MIRIKKIDIKFNTKKTHGERNCKKNVRDILTEK
jgi:hypothetical protein